MEKNQEHFNWWEQESHKIWEDLARRDYHGTSLGQWKCYFDEDSNLIYIYVDK